LDCVCSFEVLEPRRLLSASKSAVHKAHTNYTIVPDIVFKPAAADPTGTGLMPAQIRHAFGIDQISFNGVAGDGTGQTIAIVDAYDDPNIQSDLNVFDAQFGLPNTTIIKLSQTGSTSNLPGTDPQKGWEGEEALDVEWAHAIAPGATIVLVEANSANDSDLIQAAVTTARNYSGVVVVSMSFSGGEYSGETSLDSVFTSPSGRGVTFLAATGDDGQPSGYPAFSPNVVAVGGTSLMLPDNGADFTGNYPSEIGWSGSGGSISTQESQPSYQTGVVTQSSTKRANPDVAFPADFRNSITNAEYGVNVYDSFTTPASPWVELIGTSYATPVWAALIAIADQGRASVGLGSLDGRSQTLPLLYQLPASDFHDITSGNNGFAATAGFDLVTGIGTPIANLIVAGLVGASISGTVFEDANGNGTLDSGEIGQAGVTVFDDTNNNGVLDSGGGQSTISSTDVPKPIPDVTTITSTALVSGLGGSITDLNVKLNISHTYDADLVITLISPTGTQVTLASHNGGSRNNFTNTTFDDQAATSISSGSAPFSGTYRPISALSALNGTASNGTWTLQVADTAALDTGTLISWSLQITTGPEISTTTDANGNYEFVKVAPGTHNIREITPANFTETAPASGVYNASISIGSNLSSLNFANEPPASSPVLGDFNRDGSRDAGDIAAEMLALTSLDEYLATYSVTPEQLATFDDVNQDGGFNNGDLQALLNILTGNGGSSSPAAHQNTTTSATSASTIPQILNPSAIVSEGFSDAWPALAGSTNNDSVLPKSIAALRKLLSQDLQSKPVAERLRLQRLSDHISSLGALEKFFETWVG
jgi:subtilase family serine protease